jgi:hypothetical protein
VSAIANSFFMDNITGMAFVILLSAILSGANSSGYLSVRGRND